MKNHLSISKKLALLSAAALIALSGPLTSCKKEKTPEKQKEKILVSGIVLSETTLDIIKGESHGLTATVKPSDAADNSVEWSSSNPAIAIVDNSGLGTRQRKDTQSKD